jgi:hypothetical protein
MVIKSKNQQVPYPKIPFDNLYLEGIHGITHAYRVLLLTRKIAEAEGLTNRQKDILAFCAIFHDIGRINDDIDNLHGKRSVQALKQNLYFGLLQNDTDLVNYIIENHCITDTKAYKNVSPYNLNDTEEAVYLIKVFKDCDNLDRVRLGDFDGSYLRCSTSHNFIKTAFELYSQKYSKLEIVTEFEKTLDKLKNHSS